MSTNTADTENNDDVDVELDENINDADQSDDIIDDEEENDLTDEDEENDELVISIGDEEIKPTEEESKAPEWVKELRKQNREDKKRIRELENQLKGSGTPEANKTEPLGKKPTLEDFDYDAEEFEKALTSYYERKRKLEEAEAEATRQAEQQQKEWQRTLDNYAKCKTGLKVPDFEDAEASVQDAFNVTQQGIILQGAENPALLVYALGNNQKKAKALADIKDPVKFAFAVAKLETQLKVTNKKSPPPPEKSVTGNRSTASATDSTLERLRKEAEKTGDYSKVMQYKLQRKSK